MIDSKIFSEKDQLRFASLSGDYNPMHMDPVAARRTAAGAQVVHGIHTLLWLLDRLAARYPAIQQTASLKVRFPRMVYLGERVEARLVKHTPTLLRARASVDGAEVINIAMSLGAHAPTAQLSNGHVGELLPRLRAPADPTLEAMEGRAGRVSFASTAAAMAQEFPAAAQLIGPARVAALGCSSYLVGMVLPGLHSIYAELNVRFTDHPRPEQELGFRVGTVSGVYRCVELEIEGGGLYGNLTTFCRMPPVSQLPMTSVANLVQPSEFFDSTALIVGGSRGLGELTAKILAAGGSKVIITYVSGKADADRLAAEIRDWGAACDVLSYDVRQDAGSQLAELKRVPSHLYYFPTPTIFRRQSGVYSPSRLEEFNEFYVHGFMRLIEDLLHRAPQGFSAFYPSSVYVQERPQGMTEYAMAKAAGEILCADIAAYLKKVRVLVDRLPRLLTDQTAALIQMESPDPLSVLLPIVRRMQGYSNSISI